jgi:hypothetical protein
MTADTHVVFGTGGHTTSWDEIVSSATDWYRAQTTTPNPQNRLAEVPTLKVTP